MQYDSEDAAVAAAKAQFKRDEATKEHHQNVVYNDLVFAKEFEGYPVTRQCVYKGHPNEHHIHAVRGFWDAPHDLRPVLMWGSRANQTEQNGTPSGRAKEIITRWLKRRKFTSVSKDHIKLTINSMILHYGKTRYLPSPSWRAVDSYFSTNIPGYSVCYIEGEHYCVEKRTPEWSALKKLAEAHKRLTKIGD